ncbi:MAG TPA: DUF424 domain-containing protein [Methanocorpusculum sp.]|nr:DUF424 domain-containing protein [Methanocorpusculum sp.]
MYLKIHDIPMQGKIVAICDRELMNTTITSTTYGDMTINSDFYGNTLHTKEEVIDALLKINNANIIGKRACNLVISEGIVSKDSCIFIGDIPHIQIYGF